MPRTPTAIETALAALRGGKHRITKPRQKILTMLASDHGPFTIEEIHSQLRRGTCDLVTVYRNLATLEELGLVRRCDFGDGAYRYELNTAAHHHHHIVCKQCAQVKTLDLCVADPLERLAQQMGYTNVTHSMELFGVCAACQKKK